MPSTSLSATADLTVHVSETAMPAGLTVPAAAARLGADYEFMCVESIAIGGRATSLLAIGSLWRFEVSDGVVTCRDRDGRDMALAPALDPLARMARLLDEMRFADGRIPAALSSAFGFLAYDAARSFERLPERHPRGVPDFLFFFPQAVLARPQDGAGSKLISFGRSATEARSTAAQLGVAWDRPAAVVTPPQPLQSERIAASFDRAEFARAVRRAQEYLLAGDIFQVVLSLRWDIPGEISGSPGMNVGRGLNRSG